MDGNGRAGGVNHQPKAKEPHFIGWRAAGSAHLWVIDTWCKDACWDRRSEFMIRITIISTIINTTIITSE